MTTIPTDRAIIDQAVGNSILPKRTIEQFQSILHHASIDKRLKVSREIRQQSNVRKVDNVIENFIRQNTDSAKSKLRSGAHLHIVRGEHIQLTMGKELPLDFMLDAKARQGGSTIVRQVMVGKEMMALKSLKEEVKKMFLREVSIMKLLHYGHLITLFATFHDAQGGFHLVLSPWCNVYFLPAAWFFEMLIWF